jgi:hypothetical protein
MDAASITWNAADQLRESMPNGGANISRPHKIGDTSASRRQIGGGFCVAGSRGAPWSLIAV